MEKNQKLKDCVFIIESLKEYIDAIPDEIFNQLPSMPGLDWDWMLSTLDELKKIQKSID